MRSNNNNNNNGRSTGTGSSSSSSSTSIHITALDGIVNVNSLFTLAVFLGLAWKPTAEFTDRCSPPDNKIAEDMVTFHVLSFGSFFFSSLVALCLKQAVRIRCRRHHDFSLDEDEDNHHHQQQQRADHSNHDYDNGTHHGHRRLTTIRNMMTDGKVFPSVHRVNKGLLRAGILASALGSLSGCFCLMLALVNLSQIKLGTLGCSGYATAAVVPLLMLVPTALLAYVSIIFYAFTR